MSGGSVDQRDVARYGIGTFGTPRGREAGTVALAADESLVNTREPCVYGYHALSKEAIISNLNAVEIVEAFWAAVWQPPQNPDAVDDFVSEDFIITSGGVNIVSRAAFKAWVTGFQKTISGLEFDIVESFQNVDGSRVASRFVIRGRNNGFLGTTPDQRPVAFTGTAVWEVAPDGKLVHNSVERSAWEAYQSITKPGSD